MKVSEVRIWNNCIFINSCLLFAFYHDVSSHVGMCVFTNSIILHIDEIVQKSCYLQGMLP